MANLRIDVNEDMENHWPFQVLGMTYDGSVVSFYVSGQHMHIHLSCNVMSQSTNILSSLHIIPCRVHGSR